MSRDANEKNLQRKIPTIDISVIWAHCAGIFFVFFACFLQTHNSVDITVGALMLLPFICQPTWTMNEWMLCGAADNQINAKCKMWRVKKWLEYLKKKKKRWKIKKKSNENIQRYFKNFSFFSTIYMNGDFLLGSIKCFPFYVYAFNTIHRMLYVAV